MRACVTGGTGFLGGALVRRLLDEENFVQILARPSPRADELEARGAQVVRGDLGDPESVARAVRGTEVVYHIAAKVGPPGNKADFFEANLGGTQQVLSACLRERVSRVVYTSSIAVYGLASGGQRIDEEAPFDEASESRDYYAQSKIAADEYAISFARKTGLPVVIFRSGHIYGPGKPLPLGPLGFKLGKTNFVFGNPVWRIPLSYIENLIDAMQLAAHLKDERLRQYIVVDDEDLTLGKYHETKTGLDKTKTLFFPGWPVLLAAPFARVISRVWPSSGANSLSSHQLKRALQDRWYDTRRIRNEMGWEPKVLLSEAIKRSLSPLG
jgi:nucleoside-diphosphate-sugar epimerase